MQSRFRSKYAWTALISLIIFVLKTYFDIELRNSDQLVNLLLIAASAFGIFNNPTDSDKF